VDPALAVDQAGRTAEPLLRVSGVAVRRGRTEVLHDVSFDLAPGEVLAVLGPNGAGKSTLLEAIGQVVKPSAGTVQRRGRVAAAMQSPDLARRTVLANVELALRWWGTPRAERHDRAVAALTAMRADHLSRRPAAELSGGERRRVHLARAFAIQPDVLLLDEPFAGLDPASRGDLLDDTSSAIRSNARGVVLVVHDRAEAWALADRLLVLIDGRVAALGRPRAILEQPPTPEVARFLGFTGEVRNGDDVVLTRVSHAQLDPAGDLVGRITRVVPLEDGARAEIDLAPGQVSVLVPVPGPTVGDEVRLRLTGGVRFPARSAT
jgi:ABC-type nitrate/sulfonate/bicarbonate transport system ATPase subunit